MRPLAPLAPLVILRHIYRRADLAVTMAQLDGGGAYDRRTGVDRDDSVGPLQNRLREVAQLGRELLREAHARPTFGYDQLLRGIARMIAEAERDG
jgi:hypothetical protein